MNDFYTFIILSTINASTTICDTSERYNETINTIKSIHRKVPNSKIIFVDNSINLPTVAQQKEIGNLVDIQKYLDPSLFSEITNNFGSKSLGEAMILYEAMKLIKTNNLIGRRIFKIAGRYQLSDTFNLIEYDEAVNGKYVWILEPNDSTTYQTTLMSFCPTLFDEYFDLIPQMFYNMLRHLGTSHSNWGKSNFKFIPRDKVVILNTAHVEGWRGLPRSERPLYVKL